MPFQKLDVLFYLLHGLLQLRFGSYFHGSVDIQRELLVFVVDLLPVGLETTDQGLPIGFIQMAALFPSIPQALLTGVPFLLEFRLELIFTLHKVSGHHSVILAVDVATRVTRRTPIMGGTFGLVSVASYGDFGWLTNNFNRIVLNEVSTAAGYDVKSTAANRWDGRFSCVTA